MATTMKKDSVRIVKELELNPNRLTMPRVKGEKKSCVCDGSGVFTNPFDQEFKCEGYVHKMPKSPKRVYKVEFDIVEEDPDDSGMYSMKMLKEIVGYYVYGLTGVDYLDVKNLRIRRVKK